MQTAHVTIDLVTLHPGQSAVLAEAGRFNVVCCGRRWGKDVMGEDVAINAALDGQRVGWFAPTYRMMLDNFRDVANVVRHIAERINASDHRIELVTGGVIDFWSLDAPDVARGRRYHVALINEAAMVPGLIDIWQRVLRPTLADYSGSAWFLSTPRGFNDFHTLYQRGLSREGGWRAWRNPTWDNPHIKPEEIEALRAELDPVSFDQEIGANFRSIVGLVYQEFSDANTTLDAYDPALPFELGFDDGYVDPRVVLFIQRTPTRVLVFDEIAHTKRVDEFTVCEVLERCASMAGVALPAEWPTWVNATRAAWCRGNGVALPELAVGSSEAVQLKARFREADIPARGGTHHIVDGIKVVRTLILDANNVRTLYVAPRCATLISEIQRGYRYPDGERRDNEKPLDGNDHACDALRYWCYTRSGRR